MVGSPIAPETNAPARNLTCLRVNPWPGIEAPMEAVVIPDPIRLLTVPTAAAVRAVEEMARRVRRAGRTPLPGVAPVINGLESSPSTEPTQEMQE